MISNETLNILLVQLFSNGDCLYATAVARQIKSDYPNCRLTWAIADFCKSIIAHNPYVDEVLVVTEVPRNDVKAFRRLKQKYQKEKENGKWDEVFVTTNMDKNQALYNGTIRGMILGAYPHPIKVPVQPVLVLEDGEKQNVAEFAAAHKLPLFDNVILWEFAPQSGQAKLSKEEVFEVAGKLSALPSTCVIMSSAHSFEETPTLLDGSKLTVRENAALTHYCTLLIGCSSGITWLSTSSAAKQLPMLQILDPYTAFINAPSVDFKRYGIPGDNLIEITTSNPGKVFECIQTIIKKSFQEAKGKFNENLPIQFNTTRKVVYNMMCYLQFGSIARHYKLNKAFYGAHPELKKQLLLAVVEFPFKLVKNLLKKRRGTA